MHVAVSERGAYSGHSMGMRLLAPHARYQAPRTYGFKHLQHQDLEARRHGQECPTSPRSPALLQQLSYSSPTPTIPTTTRQNHSSNYLRNNADTAVLVCSVHKYM
jgi:hypothetical protein